MLLKKQYFILVLLLLLLLCGCGNGTTQHAEKMSDEEYESLMQEAETTPYGKYPETIYYSLGKVTGDNNSNLPDGDTYEDNEYTRYLLDKINVQNVDSFEGNETSEYDKLAEMAIKTNNIPDIMVVSDYDTLKELVEEGMVEDLTDVYDKCATSTIKSIVSLITSSASKSSIEIGRLNGTNISLIS